MSPSSPSATPRRPALTTDPNEIARFFGLMSESSRISRKRMPDGRVVTRVDFRVRLGRTVAPPQGTQGRASRPATNGRSRGSRRGSRSTSRGGDSGDPDPAEGDPEALKLRKAVVA